MVTSLSACDSGGEDVVLPGLWQGQVINNVTPTIQFTDLQNYHTYEVANNFCGSFAVGELVTLWYTPSHPTTIFVEQDTVLWLILGSGDVIFLLLGLAGVGLMIYVIFFMRTPAQAGNQQNVSPSSSDQKG